MPVNVSACVQSGARTQHATRWLSLQTTHCGLPGCSYMQGLDQDILLWLVLFSCIVAQSSHYLSPRLSALG